MYIIFFLFFKQKTAYEMRISDWSSDVCSSDLTRWSQYGQALTPNNRKVDALQYLCGAERKGDIARVDGDIVEIRRTVHERRRPQWRETGQHMRAARSLCKC